MSLTRIKDYMYTMIDDKKVPYKSFYMLGSEVDKPSKIFIKTSNATEYIELYIQNIEAPRTDDTII